MKHIFIINPAAGKGKNLDRLKEEIERAGRTVGADCELYYSACHGDIERYVRERCRETPCGLRFYACGGDGTLNEAANGALGSENELGMIPIGTGNDFPRSFGGAREKFLSVESQLRGHAVSVDAIRYGERIGVNMFNIGFDSACVDTAAKLRRHAFVPSSLAYIAGVIKNFVKMPSIDVTVTTDDGRSFSGNFLLTVIANGKYCGGGFCAASEADLSDGLIDLLCVRKVPRLTFVSLIGMYRNGTLIGSHKADAIMDFMKCKKITLHSQKPMTVSIDGEIEEKTDILFEVLPKALRFAVPATE